MPWFIFFFAYVTPPMLRVLLTALLALSSCPSSSMAQTLAQTPTTGDQWRTGRCTYYGGPTDPWSIHVGACNFGYLYGSDPLGWDVAAINDGNPLYEDSCGRCVEVKCDPRWISDSYGGSYDRTTACIDPTQSVIVRITDDCPCTYPRNAYSNKRWCCNDVEHLDLSIWAFEKLASTRWGVIGLKYRAVPCTDVPAKPAPKVQNPTRGPEAPAGNVRIARDWPDMSRNRAPSITLFGSGGFQNGFYDSSWSSKVQASAGKGMRGAAGLCASISPNGALGLSGPNGSFVGRVGLSFYLYVGETGYDGSSATKPNIRIGLAGSKGSCSTVRIYDVHPLYFEPAQVPWSSDYFWGWQVYFPAFAGAGSSADVIINDPQSFAGCGGNLAADLKTVTFLNDGNTVQWVCMDRVELF